ncbi:MAG: hypothetical protein H7Y00_00090 [Fimbriimonadaceae bacterium]|nr:hypothetical protein [Chitinophagales bacterium]
MKNLIIAALTVVATFSITSCAKKGMSEEMKTRMEAFETNWKNTGDEMAAMEKSMNTRIDEMKKMHTDAMGMDHDMKHDDKKMDTKHDHSKMDMKEGDMHMDMAQCTAIDQRISDMKAKCDAATATWEADTKSYNEWKDKVKKGEVENEAIEIGLKSWEDKLAEHKTSGMAMAKEMDALYSDVKAHAEADMSAMGY